LPTLRAFVQFALEDDVCIEVITKRSESMLGYLDVASVGRRLKQPLDTVEELCFTLERGILVSLLAVKDVLDSPQRQLKEMRVLLVVIGQLEVLDCFVVMFVDPPERVTRLELISSQTSGCLPSN
jgi:hypothetical protein